LGQEGPLQQTKGKILCLRRYKKRETNEIQVKAFQGRGKISNKMKLLKSREKLKLSCLQVDLNLRAHKGISNLNKILLLKFLL